MKTSARVRLGVGVWLAACIAVPAMADRYLSVTKEVDQHAANASEILTYTITVTNAGFAVSIGLFTDTFPDEVAGCAWTCSATGSGWCESVAGSGDIEQLVSVPTGSSATVVATCTFVPSTGNECAVNRAEFSTMDPDIFRWGIATTCEPWVIVLVDGFESGDTSSWSVTFP